MPASKSSSGSGSLPEQPAGSLPLTFGVEFEFLFGIHNPTIANDRSPEFAGLRAENVEHRSDDAFDKGNVFELPWAQATTIIRASHNNLVAAMPKGWDTGYNKWTLTTETKAALKHDREQYLAEWTNNRWTQANNHEWGSDGLELVSRILEAPVLGPHRVNLKGLAEVEGYLKCVQPSATKPYFFLANDVNAGHHVHIGCDPMAPGYSDGLPIKVLQHLAFLIVIYEDVIDLLHHPVRRGFADTKSESQAQSNRFGIVRSTHRCYEPDTKFVRLASQQIFEKNMQKERLRQIMDNTGFGTSFHIRSKAVNFENICGSKKTVEFRQHVGTLNYDDTKQWVIFLVALVRTAERLASGMTPTPSPDSPRFAKGIAENLKWSMGQQKKHIALYESQDRRIGQLFDLLQLSRRQRQYWYAKIKQWKEPQFTNFPTYAQCPQCEMGVPRPELMEIEERAAKLAQASIPDDACCEDHGWEPPTVYAGKRKDTGIASTDDRPKRQKKNGKDKHRNEKPWIAAEQQEPEYGW